MVRKLVYIFHCCQLFLFYTIASPRRLGCSSAMTSVCTVSVFGVCVIVASPKPMLVVQRDQGRSSTLAAGRTQPNDEEKEDAKHDRSHTQTDKQAQSRSQTALGRTLR